MKVLLTGATGFIGRQCYSQLKLLGCEVHAISSHSHVNDSPAYWHKVDLLDDKQTKALIKKVRPTHLLHLAWYAEPGKYWESVKNFHWVKASLSLFEAFVAEGGERIIVAGSCAEYAWNDSYYKEDETLLKPTTVYGNCKHALQLMLSAYAVQENISCTWGRVFSIYGPEEDNRRLVSSVVNGILRSKDVKCSNGSLVRDYLHVNDVSAAFIALLNSDVNGPVNIGSGTGVALRDLVEKIERKINNYGHLIVSDNAINTTEPPVMIADTNRIKSTGWTPKYDIESGLDDTINWFKEH